MSRKAYRGLDIRKPRTTWAPGLACFARRLLLAVRVTADSRVNKVNSATRAAARRPVSGSATGRCHGLAARLVIGLCAQRAPRVAARVLGTQGVGAGRD